MTAVVVKESGIDGIEFFGKADRNKDGKIASEVPSWYLRQNKEELQGNVDYIEKQFDNGTVPESEKPLLRERLKQMKEKLDNINESQPKFSDKQQDAISKMCGGLGKKISESMYTRSDMMKGTADAHEEARRMADPCIKLDGDEYVIAKKIGCRISSDGMVSRTDAEKIWKFGRRALGENSNTEVLRKG